MFVPRFAALAAVVITACGAGATQDDGSSDHAQSVALGAALVGTYQSVADSSAQFILRADLTYAVPRGETGTWNLYHSPISGHHFVGLKASGDPKWLRVLEGAPMELVGAFGADGDFRQLVP